jgi:hypothetical protein
LFDKHVCRDPPLVKRSPQDEQGIGNPSLLGSQRVQLLTNHSWCYKNIVDIWSLPSARVIHGAISFDHGTFENLFVGGQSSIELLQFA